MPDAPLISARSLVKRFGDFTAVDGIDVEVAPGESFGFLGPNGAGKTSTKSSRRRVHVIARGRVEADHGWRSPMGLTAAGTGSNAPMSGGTRMHARVGMPINSTEGPWGELDDFVVDPTNWHLTHLVVQPHRHHDRSRLVPVGRASNATERLTLEMSADEIECCPAVEVTEFFRVDPPSSDGYGWAPSLGSGFVPGFSSTLSSGPRYATASFDHVPDGELEISRTSEVVSSDDHTIGTVDGFIFDDEGKITHLVLDHGHLWGHREITIPIEHATPTTSENVCLDVRRSAVGEFPFVHFHRHARVTHAAGTRRGRNDNSPGRRRRSFTRTLGRARTFAAGAQNVRKE